MLSRKTSMKPYIRCRFICLHTLILLSSTKSEKAYPLGCSKKPSTYYDYERSKFPPHNVPIKTLDDYQILRRIGTGKFSDVFEAVDVELDRRITGNIDKVVDPRTICVLKCLKPVSERKIRREILILQHASTLPNLVRLLAIVIPQEYYVGNRNLTQLPRMPTLVIEHAGRDSQWLCHRGEVNDYLSDYEIRYNLYHLLIALDALHSRGIMHRDVKPRNVLINRHSVGRSLMLIDLGLADFYLPTQRYNVRVASRHYKSPELLVGYELYDYSLDLWGVGCILAGLLLRREPFFRGKDNNDQLLKIIQCLGSSDLYTYLEKYHIEVTEDVQSMLQQQYPRRTWLSFLAEGTPIPSPDDLDLLDKLLCYDHEQRLTAKQAMQHPFFDVVRERVEQEVHSYHFSPPADATYHRE